MNEHVLIVVEIAVVDDRRIQSLSVGTNNFVCILRNHTSRLAILGVDCGMVRCRPNIRRQNTHHIHKVL